LPTRSGRSSADAHAPKRRVIAHGIVVARQRSAGERCCQAIDGTLMANRHFAKLADVWKHLSLVEVLSIERPSRYWESHAGSATYEMVDDPERRYGVRTFVEVASDIPALARSRYRAHLSSMTHSAGKLSAYPGSPMLAALELGSESSYLVCDLDPSSAANLRAAAVQLGLASRVQVIDTDGLSALHRALPQPRARRLDHRCPHRPLRSLGRRTRRAVGAGSRPGTDRSPSRIGLLVRLRPTRTPGMGIRRGLRRLTRPERLVWRRDGHRTGRGASRR
jgi:hypothetical protein